MSGRYMVKVSMGTHVGANILIDVHSEASLAHVPSLLGAPALCAIVSPLASFRPRILGHLFVVVSSVSPIRASEVSLLSTLL